MNRYCDNCGTVLAATNHGELCAECSITRADPTERRRAYPRCHLCGLPCVPGQRDRRGRSTHFSCQMRELRPALRHPGLPQTEADS